MLICICAGEGSQHFSAISLLLLCHTMSLCCHPIVTDTVHCRNTLTLCHSRISMRDEAIEEDAVMAILLYEEELLPRYGM